jgi:acetyl-CoA/propionyl-CoA carboxylase, biotin carboxylase, biotin carboxyl carrier protein
MSRFGTVLVANRGEIAIRIIRAAATHGLRTVAVYSDADADAPHVREADTAVRIGPPPAAQSYLDIEAIINAATDSGADAIHPGYGFLSERAQFASAVTNAGLVFIGPPADVIELMGRKDRARDIASKAGVPVVPHYDLSVTHRPGTRPVTDNSVEWPVLVKAASGGGGKGMRIVRDPAQLSDAIDAARREAAAAFGDDSLLLEQYLERGRHIEVQIMADDYGNVLHLYERDCSVQRRHQKVVEEAPASTVSLDVRELVRSSAVALAREVGYVNAGTVEFLVVDEDAYFLEMNTRLQVEHPVTEAITGVDLVAWQFSIAQGEPLPLLQEQIESYGHAIEARVYAEDPFAGFLPQAGLASIVRWPTRARVDAALESGQRIGTEYDPMLGKIVVAGESREVARRALVTALDETAILGIPTNLGFLRQVVASPAFAGAEIDTSWLDRNPDAFVLEVPDVAWAFAAWSVARLSRGAGSHPFGTSDGWRLGTRPAPVIVTLSSSSGSGTHTTRTHWVEPDRIRTDSGTPTRLRELAEHDGCQRLELDDDVHEAIVEVSGHDVLVAYQGQTYDFGRPDVFGSGSDQLSASDTDVRAPMPGTVLAVDVVVGDQVVTGQRLGVLEAMKMEMALKAQHAGTVSKVMTGVGEQVQLGATLFVVEPDEGFAAEPGAG